MHQGLVGPKSYPNRVLSLEIRLISIIKGERTKGKLVLIPVHQPIYQFDGSIR